MQWPKRKNLAVALAATILYAVSGFAAWSQGGATIRMILPFPPGGPADAMARPTAEQIGASGGPSMVVESHPGLAPRSEPSTLRARLPTATPCWLSRRHSSFFRICASSTMIR